MIKRTFFFCSFLIFILFSCSENPFNVDISNIKTSIVFSDLDNAFSTKDSTNLLSYLSTFPHSKEVLSYELDYCLGIGSQIDTNTYGRIKQFVNDPYISRVENKIDSTFRRDFKTIEENIVRAFRYLKYHFPTGKIPKQIIYLNSLFSSNVYASENQIGIGLERYLGSSSQEIKELPNQDFYQWMKDGMEREFLERDILTAWVYTHYVSEVKGSLVEQMITWGKILYIVEATIQDIPKHQILRFKESKFKWATENELQTWKYLVKQELLFSKNERDISNFVNEGPFTIGLPEKSPDRMGQFIGWKIIHAYMEDHPKTSLKHLIDLPYNSLLQAYKID